MDDKEQYVALHKLLDDESGKRERWVRDTAVRVVSQILQGERSVTIDLYPVLPGPMFVPNGNGSVKPVSVTDSMVHFAPISILRYYPWEATLVVEGILRGEIRNHDDRDKHSHRRGTIKPPAEAG